MSSSETNVKSPELPSVVKTEEEILALKKTIAKKYVEKFKAMKDWSVSGMLIWEWENIEDYLVSEDIWDKIWDRLLGKILWKGLGLFDDQISGELEVMKQKFDAANTELSLRSLETEILGEMPSQQITTPSMTGESHTITPVVAVGAAGAGVVATGVIATSWSSSSSEETHESSEILENKKDYIYPLPGCKITSPIGPRVVFWKENNHAGIDIAADGWTQIVSICDGEVESVWVGTPWNYGGYGNYVVIKMDNGNRVLYGHMKQVSLLKVGTRIKKWDEIWLVGNTWLSGWNHLHLEIRELDKNQENISWAAFFSASIVDPLSVLPVTSDMLETDLLARVDQTLLDDYASLKNVA